MHESGGIDHDVYSWISAAWVNWREVTDVVCDRRIPLKLKSPTYKSIIRPGLLYGSECWLALSWHTQKLDVTEMKKLRWTFDVMLSDRIRNTFIQSSLGVRDVADKLQERHLRLFVHVTRN